MLAVYSIGNLSPKTRGSKTAFNTLQLLFTVERYLSVYLGINIVDVLGWLPVPRCGGVGL
jgi:hypothetical protein